MNLFNVLSQGLGKELSSNAFGKNNNKDDSLRSQLESCTYADNTKYMIEKAVKQVFHVYPFFSTDILMYTQKGIQKRFIEIKGILEIEIKTKTCKIDFNMMLPNDFPRVPPFVRIVNRSQQSNIAAFYVPLRSKTDPSSFVLNDKLSSVQTWDPSKSIVNIIIECYNMLRNNFPFVKPKSTESNMYGGTGGFNQLPNPWSATYNNPSQGFNNNASNGWGQPVGNNFGQFANQPANNGWGEKFANSNMGGMGGANNFNNQANLINTIAAAQKHVGNSKRLFMQLKDRETAALEKIQFLDILSHSLQSQENYLRNQNYEMTNFLKQSESNQTLSLTKLVTPEDPLSEQILDLMCSVRAREECASLLESRFNEGSLGFDEFIKLLRKNEEQKFDDKVLLHKCLKSRN